MRSLGSIDHFIVGAVGEPGRRTFLLEIADGADREWFLIEKEQAAAMAERGLALLRELDIRVAQPGPVLGDVGEPTFRVAEIGIGTDESTIVVVLSPQDEATESVGFTIDVQTFGAMARRALQNRRVGTAEVPLLWATRRSRRSTPAHPSTGTGEASDGLVADGRRDRWQIHPCIQRHAARLSGRRAGDLQAHGWCQAVVGF